MAGVKVIFPDVDGGAGESRLRGAYGPLVYFVSALGLLYESPFCALAAPRIDVGDDLQPGGGAGRSSTSNTLLEHATAAR